MERPDVATTSSDRLVRELIGLERRWQMGSLEVDCGGRPDGIDDVDLVWWRAAFEEVQRRRWAAPI
jgi:hypothetical protein